MDRAESLNSRREMLRRAARWTVGGGLAILCAGLATRKITTAGEQPCPRLSPCSRCEQLASCRLPEALAINKNES